VVLEKLLTDAAKDTPLAVKNMRVAVNILSYVPTLAVMRRWDLERHVPHREVVDDLVNFMMRGFGLETGPSKMIDKPRNKRVLALAAAKA
jgi:hypothetical protein